MTLPNACGIDIKCASYKVINHLNIEYTADKMFNYSFLILSAVVFIFNSG